MIDNTIIWLIDGTCSIIAINILANNYRMITFLELLGLIAWWTMWIIITISI